MWSSTCVAGFSLSLLVIVRRIRNAGPAEFSVHIFGVCGCRMLVSSYVRSGGGQRYLSC